MQMVEVANKLRDREVIDSMSAPGGDQFYSFTCFVADRLNDELVPQGFIMAVELAAYDLIKGVDGYTGKPIQNRLVGLPPFIFPLMVENLFRNLDKVLPSEFAKEALDFLAQVKK